MKTIYFGKITNPDHTEEYEDSAFKVDGHGYFDFKISFDGETVRIEDAIGRYVPLSFGDFLQLADICRDTREFVGYNLLADAIKEGLEIEEVLTYIKT